jgi:hypothetical protein
MDMNTAADKAIESLRVDKVWLGCLDGFLEVLIHHLLDNEPVKAYTVAMQIRQSVTNRIEGLDVAE